MTLAVYRLHMCTAHKPNDICSQPNYTQAQPHPDMTGVAEEYSSSIFHLKQHDHFSVKQRRVGLLCSRSVLAARASTRQVIQFLDGNTKLLELLNNKACFGTSASNEALDFILSFPHLLA